MTNEKNKRFIMETLQPNVIVEVFGTKQMKYTANRLLRDIEFSKIYSPFKINTNRLVQDSTNKNESNKEIVEKDNTVQNKSLNIGNNRFMVDFNDILKNIGTADSIRKRAIL